MKAAITGARGFVGRHLAAHLTAHDVEVVELDVGGTTPLDITDSDAVVRRVADERPDVLYHLAARSHVGESWSDGDALTRVNVDGTRAVLDACVHAGVGRALVVGSAEEYGPVATGDLPIGESTPLRPITPYGESKVAAEAIALGRPPRARSPRDLHPGLQPHGSGAGIDVPGTGARRPHRRRGTRGARRDRARQRRARPRLQRRARRRARLTRC